MEEMRVDPYIAIGGQIRAAREKAGWSVRRLADWLGAPAKIVREMEAGRFPPNTGVVAECAYALDAPELLATEFYRVASLNEARTTHAWRVAEEARAQEQERRLEEAAALVA